METAVAAAEGLPIAPRSPKSLASAFSEEECNVIPPPPPHHPTDCAMKIESRAKLPKPKMYFMTSKEMAELRKYVDANLARGFIQPAKSKVVAPILFKEKKEGG